MCSTNGLRITPQRQPVAAGRERSYAGWSVRFTSTSNASIIPPRTAIFFAPDAEPSVDAALPLADVQGLTTIPGPHPNFRRLVRRMSSPERTSPDGAGLLFGR